MLHSSHRTGERNHETISLPMKAISAVCVRTAFEARYSPSTSRVVENSSPRQTHERRVLMMRITRARLSLSAQGFRVVGQDGRSPRVSQSSPPGHPDNPAGRPYGPKVSPGLSAGGCRVITGSGPLERSLPPCFKVGVGSAGAGCLGSGSSTPLLRSRAKAPMTSISIRYPLPSNKASRSSSSRPAAA